MSVLSPNHQAAPTLDAATAEEAKHLAAGYTSTQRVLEISGVTLFFGLFVIGTVQVVMHCVRYNLGLGTVLGVGAVASLTALLAADFASGFVHWAADNWGSADWPILGAAFIRPFRHHHVDAKDITHHSFLELNGNNCIVSLPLFGLALMSTSSGPVLGLFLSAFWISLAVWVLATNQFHAWAHTDTPPAFARTLQNYGLILSTPHHEVHHTRPHNGHYCITTGWLNKPLHALRFFEIAEATITGVTGVKPNHHRMSSEP